MLTVNPCEGVQLPRKQRKEMRAMTREQATAFLKAVKDTKREALFMLALTTGMRPSEYLALKWSDVDLDAGTVMVQRTVHRIEGGGWEFHETKTDGSRRTIPIPPQVVESLRTLKKEQGERRIKLGSAWKEPGLVFTSPDGGPVDENNLRNRQFLKALEEAGLVTVIEPPQPRERKGLHGPKPKPKGKVKPNFRLYDLRHTCATLLLTAREHPKVVSERLGHASVMLTLDTYSHCIPDMQQEATEKLGEILFSRVGAND